MTQREYITVAVICGYRQKVQEVRIPTDNPPNNILYWMPCPNCGRYELAVKE